MMQNIFTTFITYVGNHYRQPILSICQTFFIASGVMSKIKGLRLSFYIFYKYFKRLV